MALRHHRNRSSCDYGILHRLKASSSVRAAARHARTSPRTVTANPGRRRSPENLAQPGRAGRARGSPGLTHGPPRRGASVTPLPREPPTRPFRESRQGAREASWARRSWRWRFLLAAIARIWSVPLAAARGLFPSQDEKMSFRRSSRPASSGERSASFRPKVRAGARTPPRWRWIETVSAIGSTSQYSVTPCLP